MDSLSFQPGFSQHSALLEHLLGHDPSYASIRYRRLLWSASLSLLGGLFGRLKQKALLQAMTKQVRRTMAHAFEEPVTLRLSEGQLTQERPSAKSVLEKGALQSVYATEAYLFFPNACRWPFHSHLLQTGQGLAAVFHNRHDSPRPSGRALQHVFQKGAP